MCRLDMAASQNLHRGATMLLQGRPSCGGRRAPAAGQGAAPGQCRSAGGGTARLTFTVLVSVKLSNMPSSDISRPMPLCFTPP